MERNNSIRVEKDEIESYNEEENDQSKNIQNFEADDDKRNEIETSQASNSGDDSPLEGNSVVRTKLPSGKVK